MWDIADHEWLILIPRGIAVTGIIGQSTISQTENIMVNRCSFPIRDAESRKSVSMGW
jgi:hypothetical protein